MQIDTSGNANFTVADAAEVRAWEEAGFVTLKTRSQFDFINVRQDGGRQKRDAVLIPSGTGDPNLPPGLIMAEGQAAISEALSVQLELSVGDMIDVITQAEDRERQLRVPLEVIAVLPPERSSGRSVLADIAVLDLVEAFYDAYALPDHGITRGKPLTQRTAAFEGMRLYATDLTQLATLQNRFETRFGISTEARTSEVQSVLDWAKP